MRQTTSDTGIPRVAVIAVHGVADQGAGDTVRLLADLMLASPPAGVRYAAAVESSVSLRVPPIEPLTPGAAPPGAKGAVAAPAVADVGPSLGKAWRQSLGSDFHREGWAVPAPAAASAGRATGAKPSVTAAPRKGLSLGAELSEFLLFKARRNGLATETYRATTLASQRLGAHGSTQVDFFEMYWADLSRLAGSVPRIVTELFTLLFRLSLLARDTVDHGVGPGAAWRWLRRLQTALDWAFSRLLALLMLQLVMHALVIAPMGLVHLTGVERQAHGIAAFAVAALLFVVACYHTVDWAALPRCLVAGGLALAAGAAILALPAAWAVGLVWLALLSAVYHLFLKTCEARFPMTLPLGWALWAIGLAITLHGAAQAATTATPVGAARWAIGAMHAFEWTLLADVLWWFVGGLMLVAWVAAGGLVARRGPGALQVVATGRLGLFLSLVFFLVLSMAAWALLSTPVESTVRCLDYRPVVFGEAYYRLPVDQAASCLPATEPVAGAADFLHSRFEHSTRSFAFLAIFAFAPLVHLLVFFAPSVLAELKLRDQNARRLGRWLSTGYRGLDVPVIRTLVWVFAVSTALVGGYFVALRWPQLVPGVDMRGLGDGIDLRAGEWSQRFLKPLVISAASATLALSALGGLLSRYVPWLRAPLDVALDVDNHFREFPRKAIPRARIFARYVALLEHIAAQGYDRVVVVSHSQGTVISAELMRYLNERAAQPQAADDPLAHVWTRLAGKTRLLTLGCPLRQLYAQRFPQLYDWVLAGPAAADLGVRRWVNAYTTGDYVGRWLWHESYDITPAIDPGTPEHDVCLGSGAHTHYLESDQRVVASWVDRLVSPR